MSVIHKELASGRWGQMSLVEKLANIGSEISRALNWEAKGNDAYSKRAVERAIDLILLTLQGDCSQPQYRELARLHETVTDYFYGDNQYGSSPVTLRRYFDHFAMALKR